MDSGTKKRSKKLLDSSPVNSNALHCQSPEVSALHVVDCAHKGVVATGCLVSTWIVLTSLERVSFNLGSERSLV